MCTAPYLEPYRHSVEKHGNSFEVTLWASRASQMIRFEVLTQMCSLSGKRLLDAGCSRGDFAEFLIQRHIHFQRYVGIDGLPDPINFAATQKLPRCEFHCGDLLANPALFSLGNPHTVVISGTLNTMSNPQALSFLHFAWSAAGESLIFNFLPSRTKLTAKEKPGPARRLDPLVILDWAFNQTGSVIYRQDYFKAGHDATVLMRKE